MEETHIRLRQNLSENPNQSAQALLLQNQKLCNLIMWLSFDTIFIDIMRFLTDRTNRYANQDKNKYDFEVTLEE